MDHNTNHDGNTSLQLCRLSCSVWSTNCHSRFLFKFDLIHAIKPPSKNLFLILTLYENSQFKKPFFHAVADELAKQRGCRKGTKSDATNNEQTPSQQNWVCLRIEFQCMHPNVMRPHVGLFAWDCARPVWMSYEIKLVGLDPLYCDTRSNWDRPDTMRLSSWSDSVVSASRGIGLVPIRSRTRLSERSLETQALSL